MKKNAKELIADAYVELLSWKSPEKIHIQELCRVAGISKSTYYYHFETLDDVAYYIIDRFVLACEKSLELYKFQKNVYFGDEVTEQKSIEVIEYVYDNRKIFRCLMESIYRMCFIDKLAEGMIRAMKKGNYCRPHELDEGSQLSESEKNFYAYSVAWRSIGEFLCWMESGFNIKPDELHDILKNNVLNHPGYVNNED